MTQQHPLIKLVNSTSLVSQILVGLVFGILLAMFMPEWAKAAGLLGSLFVGALKAVAPLLVFVLVMSAIIGHKQGQKTNMKPILLLYVLGTFLAAVVAVMASFLFPPTCTWLPALPRSPRRAASPRYCRPCCSTW